MDATQPCRLPHPRVCLLLPAPFASDARELATLVRDGCRLDEGETPVLFDSGLFLVRVRPEIGRAGTRIRDPLTVASLPFHH